MTHALVPFVDERDASIAVPSRMYRYAGCQRCPDCLILLFAICFVPLERTVRSRRTTPSQAPLLRAVQSGSLPC